MKIAVLLSGGVDSSVALHLLKEEGHEIDAYYLKIWLEDELAFLGECPWEEDLGYARAVCEKLDVPLKIVNMQQEYFDIVVAYTIKELNAGRTPSPDVMCNRNIKFGKFFEKINGSYDKVASGHYAQIEEKRGLYYLKQAPDPIKDQTYFLTYLVQSQMEKILFPLGNYNKNEVRLLAERYDLPTKNRKDSQGICFLGKIKYNDFVKFHLGETQGNIINIENDEILGQHKGFWYHTIGQRQGLGLSGGPWYVAKKDIPSNTVYVSRDNKSLDVPLDRFFVRDINWIPKPPESTQLQVKLRHGPVMISAEIEYLAENRAKVVLNQEDQGIAPGQFCIFYDNNFCYGGGIIELID